MFPIDFAIFWMGKAIFGTDTLIIFSKSSDRYFLWAPSSKRKLLFSVSPDNDETSAIAVFRRTWEGVKTFTECVTDALSLTGIVSWWEVAFTVFASSLYASNRIYSCDDAYRIFYMFLLIYIRKYKEGNNRPSSVNQISLVHNHDKSGNKSYTQDNTNTWETKVCE